MITFCASTLARGAQMTETEFTDYFARQVQQSLPGLQLQVLKPLEVRSRDATSGRETTTFLTNAYAQYTAATGNLASIVGSQVRSLAAIYDTAISNTAASIFAIVKPADYRNRVAMAA
jgi:hypothetical protein